MIHEHFMKLEFVSINEVSLEHRHAHSFIY